MNTVRSDAGMVEWGKGFLSSRQTHVINNDGAHSLSQNNVEGFHEDQIGSADHRLENYISPLLCRSHQFVFGTVFCVYNRSLIVDLDRNQ